MTGTSYDRVPYDSYPYPKTHPDHLAAIGRLFGLTPPPLDGARVLELGCAAGGNIIRRTTVHGCPRVSGNRMFFSG